MQLMVTDAAGVTGTQICAHLRVAGHQVIPMDVVETKGVVCPDLSDESAVRLLFEEHRPEGLHQI